jgi:type I restriction enzyme S subunit
MTLPSGWRQVQLGQLAKWSSGGTPSSANNAYYHGLIPWAVIGDLNEGSVTNTEKSITEAGLKASSAKIVPPGTVLLAMYGASIGRTGISGIPLATNQAIATAEVDLSKADPKFILMFLQSQKQEFMKAGKGGAQPNISQGIIKSWEMLLPPLDEQRRIVATLADHLDRLDRALGELKLTSQKRSHFQHSLLHSLFEGVAGEVAPLGKFVQPKYGKDVPKHLRGDAFDVPVVGSAGVMTYTQEALVTKPSVLVGRKGNVGAVQKFDGPCSPVDTAYYLVCPEDIDLDYLYYQLLAKDLKSLDSSTAIPSLRREDLEAVEFVKPSLSEQIVIAERAASLLSSLEQGLETIEASMKQLGLLRRSLLAKAFTGGLVE